MKLTHPILIAITAISTVGAAFGYHHLTATITSNAQQGSHTAAVEKKQLAVTQSDAVAAALDNHSSSSDLEASTQTGLLWNLLDQIIGDSIRRGTLDPSRLTPQQLALLPEKFKRKRVGDEAQLSAAEIAHIEEQIALGDAAKPDPEPAFPCPDPEHLPDNYNNAYNKMILRERGCKL